MSVQVPPDSTGKLIETNTPNSDSSGNSLQRQVITIGDRVVTATQTINPDGTAAVGDLVGQDDEPTQTALLGDILERLEYMCELLETVVGRDDTRAKT